MTRADSSDVARVREAYGCRAERGLDARYSYFDPTNLYLFQHRERALARRCWLACELLERLPFLRTHYLAAVVKRRG